jgi:hypothetical protein
MHTIETTEFNNQPEQSTTKAYRAGQNGNEGMATKSST